MSAERKAEIVGRMIELIFSDGPFPENELDGISLYLTEKVDAESLDAALYHYFASRPHINAKADRERWADYAERWKGLAEALGMDPDLDKLHSSWISRTAAKPAAAPVKSISNFPRRKMARVWSRVAAVLIPTVIAVGGYFGWEALQTSNKEEGEAFVASQTVTAQADAIREITLADGTRVTLNRGSTFSYNDHREGELTGEAYFRVAKDPTHPFVIYSDNLKIAVLGTEFDFNADASILSLYEGTVELGYAAGTQRLDGAGHRFTLDHTNMMVELSDFDVNIMPEWMNTDVSQRDDAGAMVAIVPLSDIFDMIEVEYGVTITVREAVDLDRRYSFIPDRAASIEQVMQALQFAGAQFDYLIDGDIITIEPKTIIEK